MQGSSRGSLAQARERLDRVADSGAAVDAQRLSDDLFAVTAVLDSSATLRRALTDPGREPGSRSGLISNLVSGQVSDAAADLVGALVASRWSRPGDVADACEQLAIGAQIISADQAGALGSLEDELFRFERTVAGNAELRDVVSDRQVPGERKAALVQDLLQGKALAQTVRLARQAVLAPRGRRFDQSMESYLEAAAIRRQQSIAHAVVAVPLSATQHDRLVAALSAQLGRPVQLNVDVDPHVVGGIRIEIGDEVIDGSIRARLEEATRRLAG
jgi:F-type H+-transporting ATPase subunit delta